MLSNLVQSLATGRYQDTRGMHLGGGAQHPMADTGHEVGQSWTTMTQTISSQFISIHLNTSQYQTCQSLLTLFGPLRCDLKLGNVRSNVCSRPKRCLATLSRQLEQSCTNRVILHEQSEIQIIFFGVGVHHSLGALVGSQSLAHICSH